MGVGFYKAIGHARQEWYRLFHKRGCKLLYGVEGILLWVWIRGSSLFFNSTRRQGFKWGTSDGQYKWGTEVRSWLLGVRRRRRTGLVVRKSPPVTLAQPLLCWAATSSCCITSWTSSKRFCLVFSVLLQHGTVCTALNHNNAVLSIVTFHVSTVAILPLLKQTWYILKLSPPE